MQVELAEERVFRLTDRFTTGYAEGQAAGKRVEAFGTLARVTGLFSQPRDEDYELVYREQRLQPFWRLNVASVTAYERSRDYPIRLGPEVREVALEGRTFTAQGGQITVRGLETCREESRKEVLIEGLTGAVAPALSAYLQHEAAEIDPASLAAAARDGVVVVPPQARASMIVRDVVAGAIGKIDADWVLEETVRMEAVDLFYRPVHAFRYRRKAKDGSAKEAVVEFDGVTGAVTVGGTTFEQHLGKVLDPHFLLDVGGEALSLVIPGANIAKLLIIKGMEMRQKR
jgi:hypothetical protein